MSEILLELKDICKSYPDGSEKRVILDNVSLSVQAGEFAAVVGPSGSGKSTLLSVAGLLLSPDSGSILIAGKDVTGVSKKERTHIRRRQIGFVFQNHNLIPFLKTEDQLAFVQDKSLKDKIRTDDLLRELGIEKCRRQYPSKMSGGERQRAAIARAFVNDPDIIFADEPTASLDAERGRAVAEMIRAEVKRRGKAAVMVTHDTRILDLTDKVYRIENSRLVTER
ncbi:MAG: ABC transporter ATP-binding protein [Ruminococcus sp.]|nr:ABC transporter ATP-binding protein [Ruminococcus sp.]MBR6874605.1 ABC transporter ATP-binding protein [Ruminococcus sp.]